LSADDIGLDLVRRASTALGMCLREVRAVVIL
jgi:hypothetical protein